MQITGNANAYYRYARSLHDRDKVIFLIFENNQHLMASFSKVEIDIPLSSISVRGVFFTPFISSP
jgi:hypothetical protein